MQAHAMDVDVTSSLTGSPQGGKLLVRFSLEPVHNPAKSAEAGRPMFDDVEYVEIRVPGDKTNVTKVPATSRHKEEHAGAYGAFKKGITAPADGTPLSEWPGCTRGQVETLAHFGIRTVEEFAAVNDGNLQNLGPFIALRQKARDYLAQAAKAAPLDKLRQEMDAIRLENDGLRRQVDELLEQGRKGRKG